VDEHLIYTTQYARQLDAYEEAFGRDRLFLLLLEELREDPCGLIRQVCEFLEVDPEFEFPALGRKSNQGVKVLKQMDLPIWTRLSKIRPLQRLAQFVPEALRDRMRGLLQRRLKKRFALSAGQEAEVLDRLKPDLRRLRDHYGIDVENRWSIHLGR